MRISRDLIYASLSENKMELQNDAKSVERISSVNTKQNKIPEQSDSRSIGNKDIDNDKHILPTQDVVDFALHSDFNCDRDLIGKDAALENLDLKKAISDMQRDSILREYQVFIQNPESEDGIARRFTK